MSIVTKTGDDGMTGLYGGKRVPKSSARIHAYGTIDELNAVLGMVLAEELPETLRRHCTQIQHLLFRLGADLATPLDASSKIVRVQAEDMTEIEGRIASLEAILPQQRHFILPGGSRVGALLHLARTVCRRAERWIVSLSETEPVNESARFFVNRLGDYLFLAAKEANRVAGKAETAWVEKKAPLSNP